MRIEGSNEILKVNSFEKMQKNDSINNQNKPMENNTSPNEKEDYEMKITEKTIISAIEDANKKLELSEKKLEYSIHEETNEIMVKIIDKETDEVIKEIPSEKILDMMAKMTELAGLIVDEKR